MDSAPAVSLYGSSPVLIEVLRFRSQEEGSCTRLFFPIKGILAESPRADSEDHMFTLMEGMVDAGKNGGNNGSIEDLVVGDEEGESSVASVEDQLRKGMTVYEV